MFTLFQGLSCEEMQAIAFVVFTTLPDIFVNFLLSSFLHQKAGSWGWEEYTGLTLGKQHPVTLFQLSEIPTGNVIRPRYKVFRDEYWRKGAGQE